jgi:hypothetical protein
VERRAAATSSERKREARMPPALVRQNASGDLDAAAASAKPLSEAQIAAIEKWANYREPNILFICRNVTMLLLVLPGFLLGVDVLFRNVDDFKHNAAYQHSVQGANSQPPPCGLATPDPLELLKALDRENGFLNIYQIIFQDYDKWNSTIHHGLCGLNFADWPDGSDDARDPGEEYPTYTLGASLGGSPERFSGQYTIGRELMALAKIMKRDGYYPINNPNDGYQTLWTKFDDEFCDEDDGAWYDKRERRIYGELKERIAKAYVTAAPAFFRYRTWMLVPGDAQDTTIKGQVPASVADVDLDGLPDPISMSSNEHGVGYTELGCLGGKNPFAYCSNGAHINEVLLAAGSHDNLARVVGAGPALPRFTEMLYALLALGEIGIMDRTQNEGRCFGNDFSGASEPTQDALQFCKNVLGDAGGATAVALNAYALPGGVSMLNVDSAPGAATYLDSHAALYYEKAMETAEGEASCNKGHSPPPPTPNTDRVYTSDTATDTHTAVLHACANMHQFGLFDQMRLFGLPDVEGRFVIDARPKNGFELGGELLYKPLFEDLMDASEYQNPASRLEAYLAYRVAATTIWGMLTSSCLGFFGMRSLLPLIVQILTQFNVAKNRRGQTIVLTRPSLELPVFLAMASSFLMFAYIFYLDPAIQSNSYITHKCQHWAGKDAWAPAGAFITTWYSERWGVGRYSAQYVGLIMLFLGIFPFIYTVSGFLFAYKLRKKIEKGKNRWSRRSLAGFFVLFLFVVVSLGLFAGIAQKSGDEYHVVAAAGGDTTREARRLGNDCIAAVYASFWLSAFLGHCRARWALDAMSKFFKGAWLGLGILLAAIPILQTPILVGRDLWEGKTSNGLDVSSERTTMVTFLYVAMAAQMAIFAFIGFGFYKQTPDKTDDRNEQQAEAKAIAGEIAEDAEDANAITDFLDTFDAASPFARPEIQKLMQHGVAVPHAHAHAPLAFAPATGWTGAVGPGRPRDARGRYLPMIRVAR